MRAGDLATPALLADAAVLERNVATMSAARPGPALRPHVKAFKCTPLAGLLADAGHRGFCCATVREVEGMAAAGLGDDLLLANEVVDQRVAARLGALVADGSARVTVAVDSPETIAAAVAGGVREVLVDVDVGMPRCGCDSADAVRLADEARDAGLEVRGTMGYEGHLQHVVDAEARAVRTAKAMAVLTAAHAEVGGDVVSGGGTGTWDCNDVVTELQAGSFVLMDGDYARLGLPFDEGLVLLTTAVSVRPGAHAALDGGLKALAMDSGGPCLVDDHGGEASVLFCSDEHTTVAGGTWRVGDRVGLRPDHIDPTMAKHEVLHLVDDATADGDAEVVESWPIDLRGW
ncbi:MAG: metal-activated pyridoxal enzyme [Acidimicrobiaceae bacterium]|nr:metal-activated pyridoxal enzyme [Acidimicrobiaceae bacterium]